MGEDGAGSPLMRAHAAWANARQLLAALAVQAGRVERRCLRYVPFPGLPDSGAAMTARVEAALAAGLREEALSLAQDTARLAIQGLQYLQTYDSQMLSVVVALGYGGWMAFLLTELLLAGTTLAAPLVPKDTSNGDSTGGSRIGVASMPVGAGVVAFAGCLAFLAATSAPASYYAYFALPCVFWPLAAVRVSTLLQRSPPPATGTQRRALLRLTVGTVVIVVLLELMVRAYQLRHLFAVASLVAAAAQLFPIGAPDTASARAYTGPALLSSVALAFAGAFAWLPIVQKPQIPAVVAAAAIPALFVPSMLASTAPLPPAAAAQWRLTCGAQLGVLGLTSAIVALPAVASLTLGALDAVSGTLKAAAWAVTLGAPLLPLLAPPSLPHRLASVYLGLLPGFMLVSLSWEPYFLWALGLALAGSVHHELSRSPRDGSSTTGTHRTGLPADRVLVRQALFRPAHALRLAAGYLLLVNLAFFGVGNTASVASFDVPSCYRLTTVFNPFLMGGIMMAKHLTPLLAATAAFTGLLHSLGLRPFDVYPAVLLLADVMSLRFFFQVQNTGSWAEMGESLSRLGVMNAQVIFLLLLFGVTHPYVRDLCHPAPPCIDKKGR